jgi:hypothetical protein
MASLILLSSVGAIILAYAVYYINNLRWHRKYKLPPLVEGGVPLFGNALQLPPIGHEAGVITQQWAKKYGEMYHSLSQQFTFLNLSPHPGHMTLYPISFPSQIPIPPCSCSCSIEIND